jgi:hypothetical protein
MKKFCMLSFVISIISMSALFAQDTLSNGKALNFPFRRVGISLGNSREFSGIRLNMSDKDVLHINGLNLTLWYRKLPKEESKARKNQIKMVVGMAEAPNKRAVVNGISAGMVPVAGTMQPFNAGVIGLYAEKNLNGLTAGGLFAMGNHLNGLSAAGLGLIAPNGAINGIAAAGLALYAKNINGLSVSPIAAVADRKIRGLTIAGIYAGNGDKGTEAGIEGVAIAIAMVRGGTIRGIPVSPVIVNCATDLTGLAVAGISVKSGILKGVSLAGIINANQKQHGLSIALLNRSKELHGLQIGLINCAGNNRKGMKVMPVMNMHFGKSNK